MSTRFDAAWHTRALQGEAGAIDALADHALPALFRFCLYRVGRDRSLCEEVVHETLARAIRELDRYEPARAQGDVCGWLFGLARNEIRSALRASKRTSSLEALWERMDDELVAVYSRLEDEPFSEEQLQKEETRELVNATMSQLPAHYQEALEGKYLRGQSVRDLADLLSLSEHALESRLARARQAFRTTFMALVRNLNLELIPTELTS